MEGTKYALSLTTASPSVQFTKSYPSEAIASAPDGTAPLARSADAIVS